MIPPKVFISYSHDSAEHKHWVLNLSTTLCDRGVDAILDLWELKPGDDLPHFMETHLETADFALMICTDKYVTKANTGQGGVGYEKMIMTSSLLDRIDANKIIPIIRQSGTKNVPTFLKTKFYVDFSNDDDIEYALDELLRVLLDAPLYKKPQIGANPFRPLKESRPDRTSDGIQQFMENVVAAFEGVSSEYTLYQKIVEQSHLSRLMLDMHANKAIEEGLVKRHPNYFSKIAVTPKGLTYLNDRGII